MSDPKNIVIVLLLVGLGVLGYLYYDSQQTAVRIDVPGFKLKQNSVRAGTPTFTVDRTQLACRPSPA